MLRRSYCAIISIVIFSSISCPGPGTVADSPAYMSEKRKGIVAAWKAKLRGEEKLEQGIARNHSKLIAGKKPIADAQKSEYAEIERKKQHLVFQEEQMLKQLRKLKNNIMDVDAMKSINEAFFPAKAKRFLNFYSPFETVQPNGGTHTYIENANETYSVSVVDKAEIETDNDLGRKVTANQQVFAHQYADHAPSSFGSHHITRLEDGPRLTGCLYAIQGINDELESRIFGFVNLDFGKNIMEKIHISFGIKRMDNGSSYYDDDVIVDINNKPLRGKLVIQYIPDHSLPPGSNTIVSKTYDLADLRSQEKSVLQHFKIFTIDNLS